MSGLIDNPEEYFRQFVPERDQLLIELEEEARKEKIPIVGPIVCELLHILARATQAERILELGTATGYSTIFLARAFASARGRLVTIDNDPDMAARAETNFRRAGLDRQIDMIVGDAKEILSQMNKSFDFIFLDIEKEHYASVLPDCGRLMKQGGLLVADNVRFKDADPFNRLVSRSSEWRSIHLFAYLPMHSPERDGLCLALRR
ncbi:MAG: O-methyltransferase [Candidatus Omnitrophica bacterium]|nr:O-methyltransferase [Candidatus Omnitrophota bacterium]